jgi:predicted lipid-binding transport protein (Tim44 family)
MLRVVWPRWRWGRGRVGDVTGAPPSPPEQQWTHDDQPAINSVRGDLFPQRAPAASQPESSAQGLAAIAGHDPGFDKEAFLEQVQRTFFIVQEAWTKRQPGLSRQVMADGLWQQHRVQIQGYLDGHKRNVLEDLAVGDMTIIGAHHDASYDTITVRILAACADYDVDDERGRVLRGDRQVHNWTEDWTFQRSATATTPAGGGTLSAKCPNCGAPLDLDLAGTCKYCKAPVSSGAYDWVLARIAQVPGYG